MALSCPCSWREQGVVVTMEFCGQICIKNNILLVLKPPIDGKDVHVCSADSFGGSGMLFSVNVVQFLFGVLRMVARAGVRSGLTDWCGANWCIAIN